MHVKLHGVLHLAVILLPITGFTPPRVWGLGFADGPKIALMGDVDHDGCADMVTVTTEGDATIEVSRSIHGWKPELPQVALDHWGKNCQAATMGRFGDGPGADVAAIFDGKTLRLADRWQNGRYTDIPDWVTLPKPLDKPALVTLRGEKSILAYSSRTGDAYIVDAASRKAVSCRLPANLRWVGDSGSDLVGEWPNGDLYWIDRSTYRRKTKLGHEPLGSTPAAADGVVAYGDKAWTPSGSFNLTPEKLPPAPAVDTIGDIDGDGDPDILEFRHGTELHTGDQILLRRAISQGETDFDHDGLTAEEKRKYGCDPYDPDTAHDGLIDAWKIHGYRGLDLRALGCDPRHADIVCLVSRFKEVNEQRFKEQMERVVKFYAGLKVKNPDGKDGINFHPIFLDPISGDDEKNSWQTNRDKFRPEKWRGIVHWMQVTPGGGGQADMLSDGGTCGENALWAVFVHEFGHQMGLDHQGFWPNGSCPIYTSLMNYNYSYSFEGTRDKIHYSDGSLAGVVLRETDLDETLPFPYEKVKFLEQAPYHFRLKPNGNTTLVDWNWDGVFGEKHVRADINYAYSTTAGERQEIGRTKTAPWLFTHRGDAFILYGTNDLPADVKTNPTVSPEKPGRLILRRLKKPKNWDATWTIESGGLTGDPVAAGFGSRIVAAYQTLSGVVLRTIEPSGTDISMSAPVLVSENASLVPTVGSYKGRLYLFLWSPSDGRVTYRLVGSDFRLGKEQDLGISSTSPVGLCTDTVTGLAVLGLAQNQDKARPNRWQIRRLAADESGVLHQVGPIDWVEGDAGNARGTGRITVLFDASRDTGPRGRVYLFSKGMTDDKTPWSCVYVAQQIADKTVHGGWLVKRYYDEWTQTRSAPAVTWFNGDILYAYRWVDGGQGSSDNILHVAYAGLGIQSEPMGDFDDLTFIRDFGLQNSLIYLGRE